MKRECLTGHDALARLQMLCWKTPLTAESFLAYLEKVPDAHSLGAKLRDARAAPMDSYHLLSLVLVDLPEIRQIERFALQPKPDERGLIPHTSPAEWLTLEELAHRWKVSTAAIWEDVKTIRIGSNFFYEWRLAAGHPGIDVQPGGALLDPFRAFLAEQDRADLAFNLVRDVWAAEDARLELKDAARRSYKEDIETTFSIRWREIAPSVATLPEPAAEEQPAEHPHLALIEAYLAANPELSLGEDNALKAYRLHLEGKTSRQIYCEIKGGQQAADPTRTPRMWVSRAKKILGLPD